MSTAEPASPSTEGRLAKVTGAVHRLEDWLINLVLLVMTVLPVAVILSRRFGGSGFSGAQTAVQHLTLWAGFLGALLAARQDNHLAMSTAELIPPGAARRAARLYTHAVAAAVTALFAVASYSLVAVEREAGSEVIGGIPFWVSVAVMPTCASLMTLRYILRAGEVWPARAAAALLVALTMALSLIPDGAHLLVWPLAIAILVALLLGAPIYTAFAGLAMLLFWVQDTPIASVPTETLRLVISPTLPAIPLLTTAGFILAEGGAAKRLMRLSSAWLGSVPGGTAIAMCLVCAAFTTVSGGSGVTILALGGLVLPVLQQAKYSETFNFGLVTASGSLGLLFYPSLPVLLYGIVAQVPDVRALYAAGLVPGVLMIFLVCAYAVWQAVKSKAPTTPFDLKEALAATWAAKFDGVLVLVIVAAFLSGWATIVETAALAAALAVLLEVVVSRQLTWRNLPVVVGHGATLVGAVLMVLGVALGLTSYFVDAEIPALVIAWVKNHIESQAVFLLALNAMLLVLGSVLEIYSAIIILAPLVAPLGVAFGVDKIHLAVVFLANLELGFLFPPVGLNLFLSSTRFNRPLSQLYKDAWPFLLIMAISVLMITYLPAMTTGMLALLGLSSG